MRIGVIQSSYIPWRGYFDLISSVDLFVFHDDIQYTKGDWRNRNKIKTADGTQWLTVPVHHNKTSQLICDTEIDWSAQWFGKHCRKFEANYCNAMYLKDALVFLQIDTDIKARTISQLNKQVISKICIYLGIETLFIDSRDLNLAGSKTERLINLLQKLDATSYLSGPSADVYLDKQAFRDSGIELRYKSYDYPEYQQLWGDFNGQVTVLDLIANCGAEARNLIASRSPDIVVVGL